VKEQLEKFFCATEWVVRKMCGAERKATRSHFHIQIYNNEEIISMPSYLFSSNDPRRCKFCHGLTRLHTTRWFDRYSHTALSVHGRSPMAMGFRFMNPAIDEIFDFENR
jgi:hypothetical protein